MERIYIHKFSENKNDENSPNHFCAKNNDEKITEINVVSKSNNKIVKQIKLNKSNIPTNFILSNINLIPINDQGNLGSCVANAFNWSIKYQNNNFSISRLYLYDLCRWFDGDSMTQDNGTYVSTPCNISQFGYLSEIFVPYNVNNFSKLIPVNSLKNIKTFKIFSFNSINQDLISIKTYLTTIKCPIIFGINVYTSFESQTVANTGFVPMPNTTTEELLGGHCIQIVGFNDNNSCFTCINSWGAGWGDKGKFYLPYNYVLDPNLSGDFYGVIIKI